MTVNIFVHLICRSPRRFPRFFAWWCCASSGEQLADKWGRWMNLKMVMYPRTSCGATELNSKQGDMNLWTETKSVSSLGRRIGSQVRRLTASDLVLDGGRLGFGSPPMFTSRKTTVRFSATVSWDKEDIHKGSSVWSMQGVQANYWVHILTNLSPSFGLSSSASMFSSSRWIDSELACVPAESDDFSLSLLEASSI